MDDIGVIVIMDENNKDQVKGYNITVGGGMGRNHNNEETHAYTA